MTFRFLICGKTADFVVCIKRSHTLGAVFIQNIASNRRLPCTTKTQPLSWTGIAGVLIALTACAFSVDHGFAPLLSWFATLGAEISFFQFLN